MKYRKYERERAEMLKIDEKTALLDEKIFSHTGWGARRSFEESVKDYNF